MPIPFAGAAALVSALVFAACASSPSSPPAEDPAAEESAGQDSTSGTDESPGDTSAETVTKLERSCDEVEASGEAESPDKLPLAEAAQGPVRIGPPGAHFGFAEGFGVLYTHPKGGTLYAVSPDGGKARMIAQNVGYWFEDDDAQEIVYASGKNLHRVGVGDPKPRPAPKTESPIERLKRRQNEFAEAGFPGASPFRLSARWLAGSFGKTAQDARLAIVDRETSSGHIASLDDQRLIWTPKAVGNAREIAYLVRDGGHASNLFVADAKTGAVRCASSPDDRAINPFFSPSADHQHLLYERFSQDGQQVREFTLYLADIAAGRSHVLGAFKGAYAVVQHPIPDPKNAHQEPRFVVSVHYASRNKRAFFLVEGTQVTRLTDEIGGWSNSYVSPDGAWLLFRHGEPEQSYRRPKRPDRPSLQPGGESPPDERLVISKPTKKDAAQTGLFVLALPQ